MFSASHSRTLLSLVGQTLTESSPNDLNAKQRPRALAKNNNRVDKVGEGGGGGGGLPGMQEIGEFKTKCELC